MLHINIYIKRYRNLLHMCDDSISYYSADITLPIQLLNSTTSCRLPHFVKSPAWTKTSPIGMSNLMNCVSECVSLIHTTRNCKLENHP